MNDAVKPAVSDEMVELAEINAALKAIDNACNALQYDASGRFGVETIGPLRDCATLINKLVFKQSALVAQGQAAAVPNRSKLTKPQAALYERIKNGALLMRDLSAAENRVASRLKDMGLVALDGAVTSMGMYDRSASNDFTWVLYEDMHGITAPAQPVGVPGTMRYAMEKIAALRWSDADDPLDEACDIADAFLAAPQPPAEGGWVTGYQVTTMEGEFCAEASSLEDAHHYAMVYSQDGPVQIMEIRRRPLPTAPANGGEQNG